VAAATANHLIDDLTIPTLFLTAPNLLRTLRQEVEASKRGEPLDHRPLLDVAREAPVLILDNLGAEQ